MFSVQLSFTWKKTNVDKGVPSGTQFPALSKASHEAVKQHRELCRVSSSWMQAQDEGRKNSCNMARFFSGKHKFLFQLV